MVGLEFLGPGCDTVLRGCVFVLGIGVRIDSGRTQSGKGAPSSSSISEGVNVRLVKRC